MVILNNYVIVSDRYKDKRVDLVESILIDGADLES